MNLIEVDNQVAEKLIEKANTVGVTRNGILRLMLNIDTPPKIVQKFHINNKNIRFKNIQEELIPYILKILYENGGTTTKAFVEQKIYKLFKDEFDKSYYHETVSHGVPRWKHNIAWSKERAKNIYGFIKSAKQSGRGLWELTDKGVIHCEKII
jgi:hypothetical protein